MAVGVVVGVVVADLRLHKERKSGETKRSTVRS